MNEAHTKDHSQHVGTNADQSHAVYTTISGSAELPDDEKTLKRIWLTLLPTEQVIEILLRIDESLEREQSVGQSGGRGQQQQQLWKTVRRDVWPADLKAAVLHAAVAKIVESSGNGAAVENGNEKDVKPTTTMTKDGGTVNGESTKSPPPPTAIKPPQPSVAIPTPSTAPVPPLIPIRRPSPPTSTTTYQAAASASTSYPYQPYGYGYSPSPPTLQARIPVAPPPSSTPAPPPPAATQDDEDDLPSYEEMLVQALTVHNDPEGTAPKQLFQWMAATYPLQANFRPSASQALQKAYKRGRFEKNSEGRYRLNPRWEGGNTSRRTTRRPQSYSKSVLNPSPSSHPPINSAHFLPQHYTWTYGGRAATKSQSPAPQVPPTATVPQIPSIAPNVTGKHSPPLDVAAEADHDHESHRSCMEAAYSILQALNITGSSNNILTGGSTEGTDARLATANEAAVSDSQVAVAGAVPGQSASYVPLMDSLPQVPPPSVQASNTSAPVFQTNRAALQGSLALLAAQLAELADTSTTAINASSNGSGAGAGTGVEPNTHAPSVTSNSHHNSSLASLEGLVGINFLDLAQLGVEVEPAK